MLASSGGELLAAPGSPNCPFPKSYSYSKSSLAESVGRASRPSFLLQPLTGETPVPLFGDTLSNNRTRTRTRKSRLGALKHSCRRPVPIAAETIQGTNHVEMDLLAFNNRIGHGALRTIRSASQPTANRVSQL